MSEQRTSVREARRETHATGGSGTAEVTAAATSGGLTTNDLAMLLVVLIWGANFSVVKGSFTQIPPLAFTGLRFLVGSAVLMLLLRWREGSVPLARGVLWRLVWLGFVGNTLYQLFFITGLTQTTAANTALLVATTPIFVLLLGRITGVEALTRNTILGVALAFSGIALVMAARGAGLSVATLRGDLLALVAAACWSVYTLGVRKLGSQVSSLRITAWTMLTGTPGLLLAGLPQIARTDWAGVDARGWSGLLYSSLFALVIAYVIWNRSVRLVGGSRTAVYACVTPLVATLFAWYLLGEEFRLLQGVGAVLIIGGVLLARRAPASSAEPADAEPSAPLREIHTNISA